jgi:cytochrome c-type biogenesis protein CcmH
VAAVTALVLAALAPVRLPAQDTTAARDSVARLWAPGMVQERDRASERENDSTVHWIEAQLRCTCGCNLDVYTCRTTDFTCATSPAMHRVVLARLDSGMTAPQVIARFEQQYGQAVLMAPPRRGFNWTAYIMPFVGLGVGLAVVTGLMRRWIRSRAREALAEAETPSEPAVGASAEELERLKKELERFEA